MTFRHIKFLYRFNHHHCLIQQNTCVNFTWMYYLDKYNNNVYAFQEPSPFLRVTFLLIWLITLHNIEKNWSLSLFIHTFRQYYTYISFLIDIYGYLSRLETLLYFRSSHFPYSERGSSQLPRHAMPATDALLASIFIHW